MFLSGLFPALQKLDPEISPADLKGSVFRINRDVRFSDDKSPYKTSVAGVVVAGGKKRMDSRAGFYFHIEPGASVIAGGAWLPPSDWISDIRARIDAEPDKFRKIISSASFRKYFGEMEGEKLTGNPRGYSSDNKAIDLLRYKSFLAIHRPSDEVVLGESFAEHAEAVVKEISILNNFLNNG